MLACFILFGFSAVALAAESYPNRPIRLIVPFAPGGSNDVLARIIAQRFSERLGQPLVTENRSGAGGNIAYEFVAKAKPDGHTMLIASPVLAISPSLYKKLAYDPIKDLAPISMVAQSPLLLIARSSLPVNNLKELIAYATANPGKLNYGSGGVGTSAQLACSLFMSLARINVLHIPYKGTGLMMIGLVSGEVDVGVVGPSTALPQIQAGKVKVLAVLKNDRLPMMPTVPTAKEGGIDNEVTTWYGILTTAGTPPEIVNRLSAEWAKIAAMPDTKEQLQKVEFETLACTPEKFSEFIKSETARWGKVIRDAKITRID